MRRVFGLIILSLLVTSIIINLSMSVVEAGQLNYRVNVYWVNTNEMFYTYGNQGNIYILRDQFIVKDNVVFASEQIAQIINPFIHWNMSKHPTFEKLSFDVCVGIYECGYFRDGLVGELRSYVKALGYTDASISVWFSLIVILVREDGVSSKLFGSAVELARIHMKWVGKLLDALRNENFHLTLEDFLQAINYTINVLIITTPFERDPLDLMFDDVDPNEYLTYDSAFKRFGFVIQGIGVEPWFGVYSMEIPLSCSYPELGVEYSYSSIEEIFDKVVEAKNFFFGEERVVIVIPSRKCFTGDPFQRSGQNVSSELSVQEPGLKPVKIGSFITALDNELYEVGEAESDKDALMGEEPHKDTDDVEENLGSVSISNSYALLQTALIALSMTILLIIIVKRILR